MSEFVIGGWAFDELAEQFSHFQLVAVVSFVQLHNWWNLALRVEVLFGKCANTIIHTSKRVAQVVDYDDVVSCL